MPVLLFPELPSSLHFELHVPESKICLLISNYESLFWNTKSFPSDHQETFLNHVGDQALEQVIQRGCGVTTLQNTPRYSPSFEIFQKPPGHGAGQPTVSRPA